MTLLKQINETVKLNHLQSGYLMAPRSIESAKAVANGEESVILSNGKEYRAASRRLNGKDVKEGQVILGRYATFNQGVDIFKVIGVTDDKIQHGQGGKKFGSVKQCLTHYGVKTLKQLEELQDENEHGYSSYLMVEDMEDVEDSKTKRGPWYYLDEGRWSRGSEAASLSLT